VDSDGEVAWTSTLFTVNQSNSTVAIFDASNLSYSNDGFWQLYYQKRVVDAAKWVTEPLDINATILSEDVDSSFLIGYGLFSPTTILAGLVVISLLRDEEEDSA
jgi:hypothetical protein